MSNKQPQSAAIKHEDTIEFAGDYNLNAIVLIAHDGTATDIKPMVLEMNIYEGIYNNAITGSIVVGDTQNLISTLPIQGTERLAFKLATPGANADAHIVDATEKTGHPFHIYKLTDKNQITPGTVSYILHFASREFMRNQRVKVSQSYTQYSANTIAHKIFLDPLYLDSRKKLFFETSQVTSMVIPNISPFNAMALLGKHAIAEDSSGNSPVGFYFYETTKGFYFRSWNSMVAYPGYSLPRPIKQEFYYQPKEGSQNATDKKGNPEDKIINDYKNVESYEFINQFHDVAANTAMGTYGHRVITHNLYDKKYVVDDYNYHNAFDTSSHTDEGFNHAIVTSPVDFDDKAISEYSEARVSLRSSTRFLNDNFKGEPVDEGNFGIDVEQDGILAGKRTGQAAQVASGTKLRLVVKGQSFLEAGDMIQFNLRNVDAKNDAGDEDPQYSGNYVIIKIRHRITPDEYKQVLECVKDSVKEQWPRQVAEFPGRSSKNRGSLENINDAGAN
jgi:hypothetical protein